MPLRARVLTKIELPKTIDVEIEDTIRGEKVVRSVDFESCLDELSQLGTIDLHEMDPGELITLAVALAKHRAIDQYLMELGVDPHAHLREKEA